VLLINLAYLLLLIAVSPVLLYRMVAQGKYRAGWGEKFLGRAPELRAPSGNRYWFHAVSVGEVLLLPTVINELRRRDPQIEVVVSTTTSTGRSVAELKLPDVTVFFCPLDFSWAVRQAINRIRPTRIVLVELEIWPNLLRTAAQLGIPVSLINGRLSDKSYRGYSRVSRWLSPLFQSLDSVAVQNETYAERFVSLGVAADRVHVTGSVKFDGVIADRSNPQTIELQRTFGLAFTEPVFIAGSTQAPEERIAIESWLAIRAEHPELRLVLVPRHRERFEEVARLIKSYDLPLLRRSSGELGKTRDPETPPILLLDTLGELSACWGLADFAYVGGSMNVKRGGQNMLEPAAYGAAVCFGPDTRNFRDVVQSLLSDDAAVVVEDVEELTTTLRHWLNDRRAASAMGRRAQDFVRQQHGAAARTMDLLLNSTGQDCAGMREAA
jgi:3-deoxy-D-manno-octulosonic-acid transferase